MNILERILEEILQYRKDNGLLAGKQVIEIENIIRKHMDDVKNNGWIPCSERLPEQGDIIYPMQIVTLDNGDVCLGVYRHDNKEWLTRMVEGELYYTNSHIVVAWMPLPEPYKPEAK